MLVHCFQSRTGGSMPVVRLKHSRHRHKRCTTISRCRCRRRGCRASRGSRGRHPPRVQSPDRALRWRRPGPDLLAIGVVRLTAPSRGAVDRDDTLPLDVLAASPIVPIIHSRPIVGVPKRADHGRHARDHRHRDADDAGEQGDPEIANPSNRNSEPTTRHAVAITDHSWATPVWTSTA